MLSPLEVLRRYNRDKRWRVGRARTSLDVLRLANLRDRTCRGGHRSP